jgi:hypothetical protein
MNYQVDPTQLVQMIKNGQNPQQLMLHILESSMAGTPMGSNLLTLAKNGQTEEIEKIARNVYAQRGLDFDQEFKAFKERMGLN